MQAIVSIAPGGPDTLRLVHVDTPTPKSDEVIVSVRASSVNFTDLLLIKGEYQVQPPRPFSPGGEISGVVKTAGSAVDDLPVGTRICAAIGWGGMAEEIAVQAASCLPIPATMPFSDAAAFQFTFGTAYYGLHERGNLNRGDRVLVLGAAGGIGLAAVQLARVAGAHVVAAVSSEEKAAIARRCGAHAVVIYPLKSESKDNARRVSEEFKSALGGTADIVVDPVGGALAEIAVRAIANNGRYLVLGFAGGIPRLPLNLVLLKACQIVGVNMHQFVLAEPAKVKDIYRSLLDLYVRGELDCVVTEQFPMHRAGMAFAAIANRTASGKVVVTVGSGGDVAGKDTAS